MVAEYGLVQIKPSHAGLVVPDPCQNGEVVYPSENFTVDVVSRSFVCIQSTSCLRSGIEVDTEEFGAHALKWFCELTGIFHVC